MIYIGIDTGTHTGVAVWDSEKRKFLEVHTYLIHQAMEVVLDAVSVYGRSRVSVIFEDARKRKWFGERSREKLQGAGSVKRDSSIWEDFLTDKDIKFQAVAPVKGATKWTSFQFRTYTGWTKSTNEHCRDAGMLVFGR